LLRRLIVVLVVCMFSSTAMAAGFSFTDTKGKTHRLEDYKGRWVLVNFWATWCPPCLEEMPDLVKLHETRKDLAVIGIAMEYQDPQYVKDFAENMFVSYPIVLGNEKIAAQIGQVPGLPTTYLYDPQGRLSTYHVGALTREAVERYIDQESALNRKKK
jgi:thiol-disulfide isomerase/thioredoxin